MVIVCADAVVRHLHPATVADVCDWLDVGKEKVDQIEGLLNVGYGGKQHTLLLSRVKNGETWLCK